MNGGNDGYYFWKLVIWKWWDFLSTHKKNAWFKNFSVSNYIKTFWDTDIESEMESENIPVYKIAKPTEFKGIIYFNN